MIGSAERGGRLDRIEESETKGFRSFFLPRILHSVVCRLGIKHKGGVS
jgi:hypothetical protein